MVLKSKKNISELRVLVGLRVSKNRTRWRLALDIFKITTFGIGVAIIISTLRIFKPELGVLASIAAGATMIILVVGKLTPVFDLLKIYSRRTNINIQHFSALIKIIGIAYISEFGAEICRDTGENAIASKVELAGKVLIAITAIPIIASLMELILKVMN